MCLIEITNDLYDIAARLRTVNDNYRVYRNNAVGRYEVHDVSQHGGTLAFVVPYDELDARTIDHALYTRRQNADKIFADVEEFNRRHNDSN